MRQHKKIIIAGGGTGGHIFPAIAIANALKKMDPATEFLFVGAKGKMEMEKVPQAGYKIEGIDIAGLNRSSLIKNIGLLWKLIKSFFQVRRIVNDFRPDAVIGVGGYSSFPVLRFAQQKGIPTFIHESNSFAGKANIMLGKKATRIMVAEEKMEKFFPKEKIVVTGNPVRTVIAESHVSKEEALSFFGLKADQPVVLVVGGSLGAKSINEAIEAGMATIQEAGIQLIWQTGQLFGERATQAAQGKEGIKVMPFIREMEMAYAAADVVVSRAGAMAIAELCVVGKPVIFVPYPFAAEDHQTANAKELEAAGAAEMVKDETVKSTLVPALLALVKNETKRKQFIENIKKKGVKDADQKIAEIISQNS